LIDEEAQAVMTFAPFNIEWVIQFLTSGNITFPGVRNYGGVHPGSELQTTSHVSAHLSRTAQITSARRSLL
jgi:hypothetical protein